jgi:GrpB-like predicted nucleotidyltransferase (UPF0157 family)
VDSDRLDEHLDTVLVGGRERVAITIADYDPAWPARFARERDRIAVALSDGVAVRIEHIGSTAVPGLAAKPIVDILVTVADPNDDAAFTAALEDAGYQLRVREPGHRMFRTPQRDVHVHVWADDDPEVERYLRLRDHLRDSPEDRAAYERLKRDLAARGDWEDMNHYAQAKSELIETLLARARASRPSP